MSGFLPSRRFREAQLLIGTSLVVLVAVSVALLEGLSSLSEGLLEEARRRAVLAAEVQSGPRFGFFPPATSGVVGAALFQEGRVASSWGMSGPEGDPWWPWASREAWERSGRAVAGPVLWAGQSVFVAYRPATGGRVERTVVTAPAVATARRWRWLGGALVVLVAGGGGVLAWLLIARALAPYRELLAEAARVVGKPPGQAEDRYLVEAFRTTVRRLEASEQALRQEAEELAVLSAGLAHETRNALATITGYLRLLPAAGEEKQREYMAVAQEEAAGLSELLERFLTLTQPHTLRRTSVRLADLVEEAIRRLRVSFPDVTFTVSGAAGELSADPMALAVVVENLLRNAAEASAASAAPVAVRIEQEGTRVHLAVEDRGPGVSAEVAERLFLPFASTKPSGGLGLALARRLARLHGGEVHYAPREGGGARFVLELPAGGDA
ncbi:MAG: HAMP domain-containing histidine kinase [Thermoanaerobaculaceae bacterium]|nr:HAMP domain-containing histidine kinase [Thermoanaerobaculaceae bacterium]